MLYMRVGIRSCQYQLCFINALNFTHTLVVANPVPIDFKCIPSWSDITGTFQFQLNWTIPNSTFLQEAIIKFHILLTFSSPGVDTETRDVAEVLFEVQRSYLHVHEFCIVLVITFTLQRMLIHNILILPSILH